MATTATTTPVVEPAPAATKGGMFGRRQGGGVATRGGGITVNAGARMGLALSQLFTLAAFIITLAGLSSLQKQANNLGLPADLEPVYNDVFQSANQIPYPTDGKYQFGLQWWILFFELFIFLIIATLLLMPRHLLRLKHTAMAFLVYCFTLATLQVNSLLYFKRSAVATSVYSKKRIEATLAGAMLACICNGFSIIFLGLLREQRHIAGGVGGKRVGVDDPAIESETGAAAV